MFAVTILHIRKNKNKVRYIETVHTLIAYLFPAVIKRIAVQYTFLVTDDEILSQLLSLEIRNKISFVKKFHSYYLI